MCGLLRLGAACMVRRGGALLGRGTRGCDQQRELTIDFDIGYSIKVRRRRCGLLRLGAACMVRRGGALLGRGTRVCDQQRELTINFDIGCCIKVRRFGCLRRGALLRNLLEGRDFGSDLRLLHPFCLMWHTKPSFPELLSGSPCIPALVL